MKGRQSARCTGSPRPPPAPRTVLAAAVAGRQLHGALGARTGSRAAGAPAPRLWSRWLRTVPVRPAPWGQDPGVGRMTRPRGGGSPGRSHPASWATPRAGGSVLVLPAEGCMPSWGAEAAWHTARDHHHTPQGARGRAPRRRPAARCRTTPSSLQMTQLMRCSVAAEGAIFWPRWKWECGGGKGGSAVSWSLSG